MSRSEIFRQNVRTIRDIIFRNVFLLVNGVIFGVVVFLVAFGDVQEAVFLGMVTVLNMMIGTVQEIRAWRMLQKLEMVATPMVTTVDADNQEHLVAVGDVEKGDRIKLKLGDQVPCDGFLTVSHGLEVSEALITGESASFPKEKGDSVLGGDIVTAGLGVMEAEEAPAESRIAKMTRSIKKYSASFSPIQVALNKLMIYIGYLLVVAIIFSVVRGALVHELPTDIVKGVGALTSIISPQGLLVIVTLIFAFGATNLYKRNVLMQELNAMEKIARIKNLCLDKTGTLTENGLSVNEMILAPGFEKDAAESAVAAYILGSHDSSQTMSAIERSLRNDFTGEIDEELSFSSARKFGGVHLKNGTDKIILAGAPGILLERLEKEEEKLWLREIIDRVTKMGKRIVFFAKAEGETLPHDLSAVHLHAIAAFVLNNDLRDGVADTIKFFQDRGVIVRIISGDHIETVKAVAAAAGVKNTDLAIKGTDMENWSELNYLERVKDYTIFARVKPEQKEKLIEALKKDGFTAMVGDGANDALAIKKADLGIAMFDGAAATRQIASVVLVKNSFADLPEGVGLSDRIIENIEICSSVFFNQVFVGFFFFLFLSLLNYSLPFTPLNITFINYFTVGLPCSLLFYWIVRPSTPHRIPDDRSFLRKVLPFPLSSAIPQAIIAMFAFYVSLNHAAPTGPSCMVVLSFIVTGFIFFMFTPWLYTGSITATQRKQMIILAVLEVVSIFALVKIPIFAMFYNIKPPEFGRAILLLPLGLMYWALQFFVAKLLTARQRGL